MTVLGRSQRHPEPPRPPVSQRVRQLGAARGDHRDGLRVLLYIYGSSSNGSPYGKHNEPLTKAYKANINSCPSCSDRRRMVV